MALYEIRNNMQLLKYVNECDMTWWKPLSKNEKARQLWHMCEVKVT